MARKPKQPTYRDLAKNAVADLSTGSASISSLEVWMNRLRSSFQSQLTPMNQVEKNLESYFGSIYNRIATKKPAKGQPTTVSKYGRSRLSKEAQDLVANKVIASVSLIKLNREIAIADSLKRTAGWYSSVPLEGVSPDNKQEAIHDITKSFKQLPYVERRVIMDQGHKLTASIEDVVCRGEGAIAAIWHSNVGQLNYNYRRDHAARNERIYLLRNSWAHKAGLIKSPYAVAFTDEQTMPAEEVNCRCKYQYLYNLQDLPTEFLTKKGLEAIEALKGKKK